MIFFKYKIRKELYMNKEEKYSNKCPICGRPTHKESKYCIFHASAEEKTEGEFKKALKEYIQEIKEEDKDYDFERFIFIGEINFKEDLDITVFKNANFENTTFKGDANFENTTFKGDANFWKTTFKGEANFRNATFKYYADFINATFKKKTDFNGATFEGLADFLNASFDFKIIDTSSPLKLEGLLDYIDTNLERMADFGGATFKGNAHFWKTTFNGNADFVGATFEHSAYFGGATFKGDTNFSIKVISEINFANTLFTQGKTLVIKTTDVKNEVVIDFEKVCLENVYLELDLSAGTSINFTDALLRNTKIEKDQIENHILQWEQVYLLLKNNFHSIGKYEDENWAFKKEKDMERKSNCHFKTLHKWLWSCFLNGIFGYGVQPTKVIISAILIITLFAFLFMSPGITNVVGIEEITSNNFFDCIYFSTITFTTLGYGDFRPLEGWGRILAGSEAFIGAFMMALFVYTFARRTGGR